MSNKDQLLIELDTAQQMYDDGMNGAEYLAEVCNTAELKILLGSRISKKELVREALDIRRKVQAK